MIYYTRESRYILVKNVCTPHSMSSACFGLLICIIGGRGGAVIDDSLSARGTRLSAGYRNHYTGNLKFYSSQNTLGRGVLSKSVLFVLGVNIRPSIWGGIDHVVYCALIGIYYTSPEMLQVSG